MRRVVKEDEYTHILALAGLYFDSPLHSRHAIVASIIRQLASHVELKTRLFQKIRRSGPQGRKLVEKVNVMILELQQFESNYDQTFNGRERCNQEPNDLTSWH
jgi:hypothetical protein